MRRGVLAAALGAVLVQGCAGKTTDPPAHAPAPSALGTDKEHPVPACGPLDSYQFIAAAYECPTGGNPFAGDVRRAAESRKGNVGPHAGAGEDFVNAHIVDVYAVPCPSGVVDVYVCMYHCPAGRTPLDEQA